MNSRRRIVMLLGAVAVTSCAPSPEELSLSEFNERRGDRKATGRFAIEGAVQSYGVDLAGGVLENIKTRDGRKFHYLRLKGEDGTRTVVWLDSKRIPLPKGENVVRVTGHFEKIDVLAAHGPVVKKSFGFVDGIRVLRKER